MEGGCWRAGSFKERWMDGGLELDGRGGGWMGGRVDGEGLDGGLVVGWSDDLRALETGGLKLEERSRISPKQDVSALRPRLTETPVRLEGSVGFG